MCSLHCLAGIVTSAEEPRSFWSVCRPTLGSEVRVSENSKTKQN